MDQPQKSPRDLRILIRTATPFIIVALAIGAVIEYRRATREVEQRFNEKQQYLARQSADRLSEVFAEVRKMLSLLGRAGLLDGGDPAAGALLAETVRELTMHGAIAAWRADGAGNLTLGTGRPGEALAALQRQVARCEDRQSLCVTGPLPAPISASGWVVVAALAVPYARPLPDVPPGGTLAAVLDWGRLQALIRESTRLSPSTYAWVLDAEGRLVMHPDHREQLGRDALGRGSACAQCHTDFEIHRQMTVGTSGTGRVQVIGGEPKLVAFTPLGVGSRRWSLAVATPASLVTVEERGSLIAILLFTGAISLVMIAGAFLLDRESSRRVKVVAAFSRELEAKVAERTEEIAALYDRLAALQAHHTRLERVAVAGELAAIVAHEVRTPLNALSINAQMITRKLRRGGEGDREKALETLGTLETEIQRINTLLEEHLLALVRHKPLRAQPVCLNDVVEEALRFMEPEATRAKVALRRELGSSLSPVLADPAKLRQVLLNILLNAIQAMSGGGEVRIATRLEEREELGSICISDTGPGIAGVNLATPEDVDQVFKPFTTTKEDGTGLGLAICARLVKEMGGRLRVLSRPGEGACFMVSLPLSQRDDDKEEKPCP